VLVDDGLATGLTMRAAVAHARRRGAGQVVVAVPCASAEAALRFRHEADRFVSLVVDDTFKAVGAYYLDFAPVPDHQVLAMLARARAAPATPCPSRLRLAFKNARGLRLAGELFLPEVTGRPPVVVFAHGGGSTKDSPRNRLTAEALGRAGIAALVFDYTGHGESDGAEEDATPDQEVEDLHAAIDVAERLDEIDATRLGVLGASSGAAVALRVAAETPKVRALVLRSANPEGSETAVARVTVPTLLVAGAEDDRLVATSQQLRAGLGGPTRLAVVPKGDHAFTDPRALAEAVRLSVEWFREHLEARPT
jgi:putative phosphoribosyl transferase